MPKRKKGCSFSIALSGVDTVPGRGEDNAAYSRALGHKRAVDDNAQKTIEFDDGPRLDGQRFAGGHVDVADDLLHFVIGPQRYARGGVEDIARPGGRRDAHLQALELQPRKGAARMFTGPLPARRRCSTWLPPPT